VLRIDRNGKSLKLLEQRGFPDVGLQERADIQKMIRTSPTEFFAEMGEKLLLVGEEVCPTDVVDDRIDLLAIDEDGATVIIELKRGSHKLHLLQALGYAATIADWEPEQFSQQRAQMVGKPIGEVDEELDEFLSDSDAVVNDTQRVVLIAEDFDYMVLMTAEWLTENYGVDIRCYRLVLSADGDQEFLNCTCIYPPPELAKAAIRRGSKRTHKSAKWANWDEALETIENKVLVNFFRKEFDRGQDSYLPKRELVYRLHGRRRLAVVARKQAAYVWQTGRFEGDIDFWVNLSSRPEDVKPVKGGQNLRFFLSTSEDFAKFEKAITGPFQEVEFLDPSEMDLNGDD